MPPKTPGTPAPQSGRLSSAQRRAAELTAVAGKQAQLKREAAERAAARAQREAERTDAR